MTKPVYIINGFLESGKTEFITFTLGQPYFQIKGRTLLILCEEGENEYDPALLKKSRTDVVLIEEEEEFNPNHLIELEKQYKPALSLPAGTHTVYCVGKHFWGSMRAETPSPFHPA